MLHYPKGDTVFVTSTALLALVGLFVALLWAWTWSGVGASARRVAMRMDLRGGSASAEMTRLVWPLMPLLSVVCSSPLTWWVVRLPVSTRSAPALCSWASSPP